MTPILGLGREQGDDSEEDGKKKEHYEKLRRPSTPHALSSTTPTYPSLSLLHKLPVIDPDRCCFPCVHGSLSIQGQPLMRPPQRAIDEKPSVREDDPSQEHPELGISCPRLSLQTKTSTVDRDLKGHGEKEGERKRGKEGSVQTT
ncbi:hypothetical protein PAMA_019318 [Pampus argenteus]